MNTLPIMPIGSEVTTNLGTMRVVSTSRYSSSAYVRVVLADAVDVQWVAKVKVGKKINRTHLLHANI